VHREIKENLETTNVNSVLNVHQCQPRRVSARRLDLACNPDLDEANPFQVPIRPMSPYRTAACGAKRSFVNVG
jgi:hypothetical protein